MLCNTDETTLIFFYNLWFNEFVMLKPTINNMTILDSIFTLEFIVKLTTACVKVILSLWYIYFLIWRIPKNVEKTVHEPPKFSWLQWALGSSAPYFFHESFNISKFDLWYLSHSDNFSTNTQIVHNSCWYNLYVNSADLFNDIFPFAKYNKWKPAFRLTNRCLVYVWSIQNQPL